eukprot:TRINITY_DN81282_c0_g1_i1.p1 TRINITY_DN81282_c0_g1~~TRINITY_DN81282_c0_g1_i1.p1  ORF type:complete len:308 (+),score=53.57 TRINITY_DN81282_c0_g1_i1:90-1013(+)
MIVTDQYNHRIMRFMPGGAKEGICIAGGKGAGAGLDQLNHPRGLIVDYGCRFGVVPDEEGNRRDLLIADTDNHRVVRWKWDARLGEVVCGGQGPGPGLNQLHGPRTMMLEEDGSLLIADVWNHRIIRWMPGAPEGVVVAGGNGSGSRLSKLGMPYGMAKDKEGVLYISDHLNHRVVRWPEGAKEGEVVAGGQGEGCDPDRLCGPCGIYFDAHDKLYVADAGNHRILKFEMNSKRVFERDGEIVAGGQDAGFGKHQLNWPYNISMDKEGRLIISDFCNHRIMRWQLGMREGEVIGGGEGIGSALNQIS